MISSSHLNKLIYFIFFIYLLFFNFSIGTAAVDIWEKKEKTDQENKKAKDKQEITIESPILSDDLNKIIIKIDENKIEDSNP